MPIDIPHVLSIPLCTMNLPDCWCWNFEKNGAFSVRSAYKMLIATKQRREAWLEGTAGASNMQQEKSSWKSIWHVSVPGKIRMFLWRLARHSLPTEDVREHRNMATSSSCGLCGAHDSWRHSLLDCSMSRCVRALADEELADQLMESSELSAKQWLFSLIRSLSHEAFVKLVVTLWATWIARRKAIHEGIF